jgi:hypothetical protein
MTEKEFVEIVEAACKHPGLYTPNGTFYEAISFIEGFGVGAKVEDHISHLALTPFMRWLIKKWEWKSVVLQWTEFRDQFSSDSEAFHNFLSLYKEYVNRS